MKDVDAILIGMNMYNDGYDKALNDMAEMVKALRYDESNNGSESYYTIQAFCDRDIDEIVEFLKDKNK